MLPNSSRHAHERERINARPVVTQSECAHFSMSGGRIIKTQHRNILANKLKRSTVSDIPLVESHRLVTLYFFSRREKTFYFSPTSRHHVFISLSASECVWKRKFLSLIFSMPSKATLCVIFP